MAAKEKTGNAFVETIKTIVYALLIAGVFRSLFFQPFWIPSGSMKETLLIGDFLFVNKMAYGYSYASCPSVMMPQFGIEVDAKDICGVFDGDNGRLFGGDPERGDVVVFRHPVSGRDYIKRLIGLPGDTVEVIAGVLQINGRRNNGRAGSARSAPALRKWPGWGRWVVPKIPTDRNAAERC